DGILSQTRAVPGDRVAAAAGPDDGLAVLAVAVDAAAHQQRPAPGRGRLQDARRDDGVPVGRLRREVEYSPRAHHRHLGMRELELIRLLVPLDRVAVREDARRLRPRLPVVT